jgi:hypothetical protein
MIQHGLPRSKVRRDERMNKGVINYMEMIYEVESISIRLSAPSLHTVPTSSSTSTDFEDNHVTTTITKRIIY